MKHKYLYFSVFIGFVLAFGVSVMLSYKKNCVEEHSILRSVSFAQYKDYFLTGFLFDYLGINCQGKYNEFSTVLPHDSYIMSYSIGSAHTFCVQEECQRLVMKLESCVLADNDNGELTQKILSQIRENLELQKKYITKKDVYFPAILLKRNIERVEYSLVRILEKDAMALTVKDVLNVLPDNLFIEELQETEMGEVWDYFYMTKKFRDLIMIGVSLNRWKYKNADYPKEIASLIELSNVDLQNIIYEKKDGMWQLYYHPKKWMENMAPFNVYVPVITKSLESDWPLSKCLWLSSDFSLKRSLLLRNGELNADNKIWGCRLIDGRIRKLK